MIIIDERNFLEPELRTRGFEVYDFFEGHQVLSLEEFLKLPVTRRLDVLLVDTQTILAHPSQQEDFRMIMNTFLGTVFFHDHANQSGQDWVRDQAAFLTKIVGEYSLPMPQLQWTMLSNQLSFFWSILEEQSKLQQQMTAFSQELDQVLQKAELEMTRAKKIQLSLVPRRSDEIKGIKFYNRYAAGDGGGGEFYDLHQTSSKIFQIFVSSQSYLISSALLGILQEQKQKEFLPSVFIKDAVAEIGLINDSKKKKSEVDLLILELDLNHFTLTAHGTSKAELYSLTKGPLTLENGSSLSLEKGEKFIFLSRGFLTNWADAYPEQPISTFISTHEDLPPTELLGEMFFQLSEGKESQFLKKDATVVMMEVNRHVIHKI